MKLQPVRRGSSDENTWTAHIGISSSIVVVQSIVRVGCTDSLVCLLRIWRRRHRCECWFKISNAPYTGITPPSPMAPPRMLRTSPECGERPSIAVVVAVGGESVVQVVVGQAA